MAIRGTLIVFFIAIGCCSVWAQADLVRFSGCMLNDSSLERRKQCASVFEKSLDSLLAEKKGWDYPLDTIRYISALTAPDEAFKIITWNVPQTDGTFAFYGRIRFADKGAEIGGTIALGDGRDRISKAQTRQLTADNWYGSLVYKIIKTKHKRKSFYTLLCWNGNTALSNQKIIDVMMISKNGEVKFGAPIFEDTKGIKHRIVLEYAEQAAVSLRYIDQEEMIVFDHLVPSQAAFEGQYAFYSSDFSNDAYRFDKGKWRFIRNYEARNERDFRPEDFKKPQKGLR
jgi:hypothetical protein